MTPPSPQRNLIAIFGASRTEQGTSDWDDAFRLGATLAQRGHGIVTGGYGGTMEAVSAGAASIGTNTPIVGVTVPDVFRNRSGANPFVTREIQTPSLLQRMETMLVDASAAVALPGSLGTFTEVMVAWNLAYVARFRDERPRPLVTVGPAWRDLCAKVCDVTATDGSMIVSVSSVDEVPDALASLR